MYHKTPPAELSRPGLVGTSRDVHGAAGHSISWSFGSSSQHVLLGFHNGVAPLPVC